MSKIINNIEVEQFKKDGAVLIKGKFDNVWIEKLKEGIKNAKNNPSPRFVNHTKDKKLPGGSGAIIETVAMVGAITEQANLTLTGELDAVTLDISGNGDIDGNLFVGGNIHLDGSNQELRFYEGSNYVGFEAPALSADQICSGIIISLKIYLRPSAGTWSNPKGPTTLGPFLF